MKNIYLRVLSFGIFFQFMALGIFVCIVIGVFLSMAIRPALTDFVFREQELSTVIFINRIAAEVLVQEDFSGVTGPEERARFQRFYERLQIPGLFRLKVWDPQGVVVYSDKRELIGQKVPNIAPVRDGFSLQTTVILHSYDRDDPHDAGEEPYGDALLVYAPITFGDSAQVVGVVETYARAGFVLQEIGSITRAFAVRITSSLIILFVALSYIAWQASRTVDRQRKKLQEYATGLEDMVRKRTEQLEETGKHEVEQSKELLRLKDQFVFIAAHELNSPATALKWGLAALQAARSDFSETERDLMRNLKQATERLIVLVEDILGVARLENKTIRLNLTVLSVGEVAGAAIREVEPRASDRHVVLKNEIEDGTLQALADPVRLKEVFVNFLTNGIKYAKPEGGEVRIWAESRGKEIVVHVSDTGLGIRKEEQQKVFEKFFRSKDVHDIEGTGLGLFIVKHLIELMSGKLSFESTWGAGTTFSFSLPRAGESKGTLGLIDVPGVHVP
ncbi:MAG: hypothetical protein A3I44_01600 [Candidatus Sungbacteria bacterium RIFCSPLOWO2_02_FULL_51_17]|uniref:histidine kinase n=1 Tax=Candidatus Sungbacteria bacterium RIFCSPHIGHO2_02_FULL_51_29 TaxID=1802273 RepID=A0A1G2KVL4_9BACT|nr:MAG: hypothetical protein A2676_00765 [Candidatus Sungbacteria bacterium RIFCSPHIGHO2_01_FULL_51_22]OHA03478.1 MAG: hypothetical protein A3C16_00030 [Candidatus Sungbacteria bacterium RIFCSPHIGHO2_02_FULL_51_29]OHA10593.1 MAG: hypothetical protein A3I44_01600 [Candidatus Sungbacteria bacterium RIFCSPLOWO2_02_FULL_51_17]